MNDTSAMDDVESGGRLAIEADELRHWVRAIELVRYSDLDDITIADGEALCTAIPDLGLITVYGRSLCPADLDGSGAVNIVDFVALVAAWGPNPGHPADLDGDGFVSIVDFLELLANWGPCP